MASKAIVTPDGTISGSYDWLRLGQGATDRQVAYRNRSLRAIPRTICGTSGSDQRPMYDQSWLPATYGTINRSLHPATDGTSNRGIL